MIKSKSEPFTNAGRGAFCALAVAVVAALSGCSSLWGGSSKPVPAELGANVPVLSVRQAWTSRIGPTAGMPVDIHVSGSAVTLASAEGTVVSIDARSGADLWRANVGVPLSAGVGSDGQTAAVISRTNALIVLKAGQETWQQQLPAQVFTAPLVAGGRIFVLSADRSVVAFDAASGRKLWTQQRSGETLVLRQAGVLRPVGDTLVVGLGGRLVGLNPDNGTVRWEAPLASPRGTNDVERLVELVGRSSREGESLCVRAFQASVGCVSTARGSVVWSQPANGAEGIHGDGEAVFGTESNGTVIAWKRADGSRLWASDRLRHRGLTAPLLLGRSVVVGDNAGLVHLMSRADGEPLNRLVTDGSPIVAAPVAAADTLVVLTRNGGVFGFRPD